MKIFNILGKEVFKSSKLTSNEIDISKFDRGIYIMRIEKGNQQKNIKLIKE